MREIKFRAWDTEAESYLEIGFDFRIDGNGNIYRRAWGETVWDRTTNLILEQFTGLKDKNGKEDYDGNIWEVEYRSKKHRFSHKSELSWEGYIFSFKCLTGEVSPVHANVEEDGIIIGTIHTHPELMEQDK